MTVTFNVSNNDVAFRYTFDQLKAQHLIVNEEKTAFNLLKGNHLPLSTVGSAHRFCPNQTKL